MDSATIRAMRLANQRLTTTYFKNPDEVVSWFGGIQAQDYPSAQWAIHLRAPHLTKEHIERAYNDGRILRTHVMRPTWHFVTPQDSKWMLMLTGPRIIALSRTYYTKLGLDESVLLRSQRIFKKVLKEASLTRKELRNVLDREGIKTTPMSLSFIMMRAEAEALICNGPMRGKQFTYALLDERAPNAISLTRDAALTELTRRYFRSHGPATIYDFVWWSGLVVGDAKKGVATLGSELTSENVNEKTYYWFPAEHLKINTFHLLPNYDEYSSYKNREALIDSSYTSLLERSKIAFTHMAVRNGEIIGTWKRSFEKKSISVQVYLFRDLDAIGRNYLADVIRQYGSFLKLPATLNVQVL